MSSTVFFDVRQRTASGADPDEFVQEKRFPFDLAVTARGSRLFVHAPGRLFEVDREGQVLAAFERNDTTGELISLPAKLRPSSMLEVAAVLPDAERVRLVQALAKTYPSLVGDNGGGASPIHNSHSSRSWMGETETVTVPSTSSCTRRCSAER